MNDSHLVSVFFLSTFPSREPIDEEESTCPHDDKVADHRHEHTKDVADIINDPIGLLGKDEDDARRIGQRYEHTEGCLYARIQ